MGRTGLLRRVAPTSSAALCCLLAACGGGGGGGGSGPVVSVPAPAPSPSPTPPPPSTPSLGVVSGETSFANFAAHTTQQLAGPDDTVTATATARTDLTFRYNAGTGTYTVSANGAASSFGEAQRTGQNESGDITYRRATSDGFDILTLFNPATLGGAGTRYVTAGLWQRRVERAADTADFQFDVFVYGFPTPPSGVPVSGSATYAVDLFGVASPVGAFPRSVIGDGTLSLDFAQGLFAASGEAGEYNNDADYSSCCTGWRASGYLSSSGALTGNFGYDGRDRYSYQAAILGALYGPDGSELGLNLVGGDGADATFAGFLVGARSKAGIDVVLSALQRGERSYFTFQGTSVASRRAGQSAAESGAYYFPATFGRIEFGANEAVTPRFGISDSRFSDVTFAPGDRQGGESNTRFDVYRVRNANGDYRLEMFKPGPANSEIALTYSSFGHWQENRAIGDYADQQLSTWFSYGVRTAAGTLPKTGSAHYNAAVLGSGTRLTDFAALTLSGSAFIDVDFATATISGMLDADARTASQALIDLPQMTFRSTDNAYAFDTLLFNAPGHSPGSIRGSLYGPGGEEIGGSFEFYTRAGEGGQADATYSGVFYGKKD